ncbi:hypothetical protein ACIPSE_45885 [Streptomyces sp. NPDC090106]|uniref:hypothetical protein n=1 Tax=Streptomyces sp. NPDC090106 TaxID=3365946 RepID=UPI003813A728
MRAAGGFGFFLLPALVGLHLLGALGFGVGGELVLDYGDGVRVVRAARVGEQLRDARPLGGFGQAAGIVGEVLVVADQVLLQFGFLEGGCRPRAGHAAGPPTECTAPYLRPVDRLAHRCSPHGYGTSGTTPGGQRPPAAGKGGGGGASSREGRLCG